MRTFAQEPKATQQATLTKPMALGPAHSGQSRRVNSILRLQRTIGNQAVQRLLEANTKNGKEHSTVTGILRSGPDFLQIPVAPVGIQPKLTVGTPGDIYEQEAGGVANMVTQMPDHGAPRVARDESDCEPVPPPLGRQEKIVSEKAIADEEDVILPPSAIAEKCDRGVDSKRIDRKAEFQPSEGIGADRPALEPNIGTGIETIRRDGRVLTSSEGQFMEPRFGADLSAIGIHTNREADTRSGALHARAFALRSDTFFRAGEYTPEIAESNRPLAHEPTHSLQQGAARPLGDMHIDERRTAVPLLQRQPVPPAPVPPAPGPPAPVPAPVVAPVGRATLNFLPILQDQAPAGWGVTAPDRAVLDITAFADGATWKSVITTADQQTHQGVRRLPGVVEVTPALVAAEASCPTLQTMITSLDTVANQGAHSGFYMLAAVRAHENLHVTQWQTGMAPHYTTLRTAIAAMTVPLASAASAAAAKTAIKALPAFTAAMATYRAGETAVASATASHAPIAPFNAAEHGVVDPMINTIKARRTALKCAP